MKSYKLLSTIITLAIFCSFFSCQSNPRIDYDIISLEGEMLAYNISNFNEDMLVFPKSDSLFEIKMVASEGDIIIVNESYFRYDPAIVQEYKFSDLNDDRVYLNGNLFFHMLIDSASWAEFKDLTPEEISKIQCIGIEHPLTEEQFTVLEKYQDKYNDIGLLFSANDSVEQFTRLISILEPSWLMTDSLIHNETIKSNLYDLELLYLYEADFKSSDLSKFYPKIQQLIIGGWEADSSYMLDLNAMKKLRTLTIFEADLQNLSNIALPVSLQRLHFNQCDLPEDLSMLSNLPRLKGLSLSGCKGISILKVSNELPNLLFLSLPEDVSQDDLELIIQDQKEMEVLELIGCDSISDLSSLNTLERLKALTIAGNTIDPGQLHQLHNLKLLVLDADQFQDDSVSIAKLQSALPELDIYPGGGLCLGSGWILIMLPFIILVRYIYGIRRREKLEGR